jgi:hypothetical protein
LEKFVVHRSGKVFGFQWTAVSVAGTVIREHPEGYDIDDAGRWSNAASHPADQGAVMTGAMNAKVRDMIFAAAARANEKLTAVHNGTYRPKIDVISNGRCARCGAHAESERFSRTFGIWFERPTLSQTRGISLFPLGA